MRALQIDILKTAGTHVTPVEGSSSSNTFLNPPVVAMAPNPLETLSDPAHTPPPVLAVAERPEGADLNLHEATEAVVSPAGRKEVEVAEIIPIWEQVVLKEVILDIIINPEVG